MLFRSLANLGLGGSNNFSYSPAPNNYSGLFSGGTTGIPGIDYSTGSTDTSSGTSTMGNIIGSTLPSLMSYNNQQNAANAYQNLSNTIIQHADPFYNQRGQYQGELSNLMTNPSQFLAPFTQGAYNLASDAAMRTGAAQGSFQSGTTSSNLLNLATQMMSGNALNFGNLLGNLSGANIQPGYGLIGAGNAASTGINTASGALNNITSAMQNQNSGGLGSIFGSIASGVGDFFSGLF